MVKYFYSATRHKPGNGFFKTVSMISSINMSLFISKKSIKMSLFISKKSNFVSQSILGKKLCGIYIIILWFSVGC